ncbi:FAD-dependent oxidoreductase [Massilia arenosa]|uniref:FAD-dependent oxidoreductase n=1 Tax=Zemynaea arenosa TaxID=2561931 RepID=A0A4Y9S8T5_9BURK|nr:FAD-dependent oxidoreductase [Massilia arenosa]TFW16906.1 FAD-dependent oxidoreductase [Massilia arenosa]
MSPLRHRIAVIGSGISGLASAYFLQRQHDVTLYEAAPTLGGHTNTVDVTLDGVTRGVDTGFLVYNERTYPNLIRLFAELNVATHASDMSFAVSLDDGALEWAGTSLATVFAQRRNLASPAFLRMLRDILHFNKHAPTYLRAARRSGQTLGQLLDEQRYGRLFREAYLLPMAAAIWSSAPADILNFPAATFITFCLNHCLLQVTGRPQWRTVAGGARHYVEAIAATLRDCRPGTPVLAIRRGPDKVLVESATGAELYDAVVLATHAPTSLALLDDADPAERAVLGAVRYQPNTAWLHTDPAWMPRRRAVWSAWNTRAGTGFDGARPVCLTYWLNQLQALPFETPVLVTLNPPVPPADGHVLGRFDYAHPVMDAATIEAQRQLPGLQGRRRLWFAGAWTGYGFHEDGLKSALRVAAAFGCAPDWTVLG